MSESPDHDDPIEEVASNWLTERAEGLSAGRKRAFELWCRADPRHAAAVARLEAACALLGKMPLVRAELQPVVEFPVKPRAIAPVRRFPIMRNAVGLAAAIALTVFAWWQWGPRTPVAQVYATSTGGYERVALADGSVVELNANSKVRVQLLPNERRLALVEGEAHFTVAHDSTRPFTVSANGVAVRAVGTAFNIRLASTAVEVLVTEGKVAVSDSPTRSAAVAAPLVLAANERTLISTASAASATPSAAPFGPEPLVERVTSEALRAALSWQERKLVFSETPLRDVVAQFNRRNRLQIILEDAVVAERLMGGTFAADNVEGFVRLLEGSGTISVERRDPFTVVLRAER
jgi:transmembrane sensor